MHRHRDPYPPEFRQQMVDLVRAGRTPEELARDFEPSAQAIRRPAPLASKPWPTPFLELELRSSHFGGAGDTGVNSGGAVWSTELPCGAGALNAPAVKSSDSKPKLSSIRFFMFPPSPVPNSGG